VREARAVGLLLLIVIWSVGKRFVIDMPNIAAGTLPEDEFDHRYVERARVAYLHIVPGALYLFLHHSSSPTGCAAAITPSIAGWVGWLPLRA
jgi:hypothetical protein